MAEGFLDKSSVKSTSESRHDSLKFYTKNFTSSRLLDRTWGWTRLFEEFVVIQSYNATASSSWKALDRNLNDKERRELQQVLWNS